MHLHRSDETLKPNTTTPPLGIAFIIEHASSAFLESGRPFQLKIDLNCQIYSIARLQAPFYSSFFTVQGRFLVPLI
jgi:hypothetical protein